MMPRRAHLRFTGIRSRTSRFAVELAGRREYKGGAVRHTRGCGVGAAVRHLN